MVNIHTPGFKKNHPPELEIILNPDMCNRWEPHHGRRKQTPSNCLQTFLVDVIYPPHTKRTK